MVTQLEQEKQYLRQSSYYTLHPTSFSNSPLSDCNTPVDKFSSRLSDRVDDTRGDFDVNQCILKLYIQAALRGDQTLPQWDGLATALQAYFNQGWQEDKYTLQQCENRKAFLFWNAVAHAEMKLPRYGLSHKGILLKLL